MKKTVKQLRRSVSRYRQVRPYTMLIVLLMLCSSIAGAGKMVAQGAYKTEEILFVMFLAIITFLGMLKLVRCFIPPRS